MKESYGEGIATHTGNGSTVASVMRDKHNVDIVRGRGSSRHLARRLASTVLLLALGFPPAAAGELQIEVSELQHITMNGSSDSLRTAIEKLCAKAGVELRSYDAEDRSFSAHFKNEPLSRVLERLLRLEAYMVGVRGSDAPSRGRRPHKVTW